MNTLFIAEWFMPSIGGSVSIYKNVYSRYKSGDIVVLTKITKGWKEYDKASKITTCRIPYITRSFLKPESLLIYLGFFAVALFLIVTKRIKLIHCDKVLRAGFVGYIINRIFRIPYIVYAHGEEIMFRMPKNREAMKKIYNSAASVIVNSNNTREILLKLGVNKERISVIYPGVDFTMFNLNLDSTQIRKRYCLENKTILLTVARLEKRKGHDTVLRALPAVISRFPNTVYLIVGKGEEEYFLRGLVDQLNLGKNVIFAAEVDSNELPFYYCCCDIFIMPNRELENGNIEGFGIVFIEAAACGKPCIGGRSGGTRESIIDNVTGCLVDPTNTKEIADKIIFLLENPELSKKMGLEGRKRVENEFGWDRYYSKVRLLENKIINT